VLGGGAVLAAVHRTRPTTAARPVRSRLVLVVLLVLVMAAGLLPLRPTGLLLEQASRALTPATAPIDAETP